MRLLESECYVIVCFGNKEGRANVLNVLESLLHATAMIGVLILGAVYMTVVWLLDGESEGTKSFMWLASCLVGVAYLFTLSPWLALVPPALLIFPAIAFRTIDSTKNQS